MTGLKIANDKSLIYIGDQRFIRKNNKEFRTVEWKEVKEYGKRKEVDTEGGKPET